MRKIVVLILVIVAFQKMNAQEFNCKAVVLAEQVQGTDPKVFKTLQQAIGDFVNTRKWGNDVFDTKEKIECVFTLVINKNIEGVEGGYEGRLSVQATRPVFNSTYTTSLVNYVDKDFAFKYIQFQPLDFSDNRISGNDALASNLTAVIAYYSYIILGLDYDSFSLKGGTDFFSKAQNIANNAPENKSITGWRATESQKNRFWLVDQILNNRFVMMRDVFYKYHRLGLDKMSTEPEEARNLMNSLFPIMAQIHSENPSSMWMQFFFNAKNEEVANFISESTMADKQKLIPMVSQLDVSNASKYANLLKN